MFGYGWTKILIDHARARVAAKRGGAQHRVSLSDVGGWTPDVPGEDLLALDAALTELESIDPRAARVVELRFFGGLGEEDVAVALGVSAITVKRDWKAARAWLLLVETDKPYTARYMEAVFPPGFNPGGAGHRHPGPEAWYLVSGGQCLETPNGLVIANAGGSAMVPEGWPMTISAMGPETRRSLVLILHKSDLPFSMDVDDAHAPGAPHSHWRPQGLCPK